MNTKLLAKKVSAYRKDKGLSKTEMGSLASVSRDTIRRAEQAHLTGYTPTLSTIIKLAKITKTPIERLAGVRVK